MNKSSTIRARIEPDLKNKAEHIFRKLGLTTTQAITLFYKQVDAGRNLVVCEDADDMFRKLGI